MAGASPGPASYGSEPELAPLVCVSCGLELTPEGEPWPEACPNCGAPIDLRTQFAYCRAVDAFNAGQSLLFRVTPGVRRKTITTEDEMEGLKYYSQAFTSLYLAFQGRLAESQRRIAIEMMSAIVLILQQHSSVSPFEASYWKALMMELTMQQEGAAVREKIDRARAGIAGWPVRWRWRQRLKQLEAALLEVDTRIARLERAIKFIETPKARRKILPPLE